MIHSRRILQSALRHIPTQTRAWRQPARNVSTAAPALPNASRQPSRWTRRLIYAGIFGALGLGAGNYMDRLMFEPPFLPGSPDDKAMLADIQLMSDGLPIVQALRNNPDYVEKDVYEHFSDEHKSHRLTSGPLAGSGRLAFQVSFPFCWRLTHVRSTCSSAEPLPMPNLGIPSSNCVLLYRKFSGTKRRKPMLAWSILDTALRAGHIWSTAVQWPRSSMRI
jgi:hypothetical protein